MSIYVLHSHKSSNQRSANSAMLDPKGRAFVLIQVLYYCASTVLSFLNSLLWTSTCYVYSNCVIWSFDHFNLWILCIWLFHFHSFFFASKYHVFRLDKIHFVNLFLFLVDNGNACVAIYLSEISCLYVNSASLKVK